MGYRRLSAAQLFSLSMRVGSTYKARGRVSTAGAFPDSDERVGTQRPRPVYRTARKVRRDDQLGRPRLLHPLLDGPHHVETAGPFSASTVSHSRHHEETRETRGLVGPAHRVHYALVIVDAVLRRDQRVAPTVIEQQLPAVPHEFLQV